MKSSQEIFDAGYAIQVYDPSPTHRAWAFRNDRFKTEGVAMDSKGIWDDMGDRWVWRDSQDGGDFHIPSEPKKGAYVPFNGTLRCIGLWIDGQFIHLFKMPNDSATS